MNGFGVAAGDGGGIQRSSSSNMLFRKQGIHFKDMGKHVDGGESQKQEEIMRQQIHNSRHDEPI